MSGSLNKVSLIGNLGKDPETRYMQDGSKVVNFSVATSDTWKDKSTGERRERTQWHKAVVFNQHLAEIAEKYLKKGSKVYLEGSLETRSWENKEGQKVYVTEVILQRFRGELTLLDSRQQADDPQHDEHAVDPEPDDLEGEIPF